MHVYGEPGGRIRVVREEKLGNPNAGLIKTSAGAVLVDALRTPSEGAALRELALAEAGSIRALVYTHEHGDHHLGSTGYPPTEVIASESTARGIEGFVARYGADMSREGLAPLRPDLLFERTLRFCVQPEVVVTELGGHATGSSVVYVPSEGVLFAGDLIFLGRLPWVGDGRPDLWAESLRTLEDWDFRTLVPGHGPVAGKEVLGEQRRWLEDFWARSQELRTEGRTAAEALKLLEQEFGLTAGGYNEHLLLLLERALKERFGFAA